MKIKSILLPAALLVAFAVSATALTPAPKPAKPAQKKTQTQAPKGHFAPGGYGHKPSPGGRSRLGFPDLKLTPAQKAKVVAIQTADRKAMKTIMSNTKLTEDAKRAQMMALGKASRAKMDALLTPEQKKKLDAWRKDHPRPGQGPGARPKMPGAKPQTRK